MAATTPVASLLTFRQAAAAEGGPDGKVALPLELVDVGRRPFEGLAQRGVELRAIGQEHRCAYLGHELGPEQLLLLLESGLQLCQTPLAQLLVGRPVGLVEGLAGGGDGGVGILVAGVRHLAEDVLRGRVDVVEGLSRPGLDEFPADQHPGLARHGGGLLRGRHGCAPLPADADRINRRSPRFTAST